MMKTITAFLGGLCLLLSGMLPLAAQAQSCPAPSITSITKPTPGTLVVNFTPVATAQSYVVRYFWSGDSTVRGIRRLYTPSSPGTLTGLRTSSYYSVRVGSICSPGDTVYSPAQLVITSPSTTPTCNPISSLQASTTGTTTAQVRFNGSSAGAVYTIRYAVAGTSLYQVITTSNTSASLSGLQPGTTYVVEVSASCGNGSSSTWVGATFRTNAATTPPSSTCGAVTNVVITATSDTTALVSFTPGAGNTSFQLTYTMSGDTTRWTTLTTTSSPFLLAGLIPGHTYYIWVRGLCGSGSSTVYAPNSATSFSFRGTSALSARGRLGAGLVALYPNPAHGTVQLEVPAVAGASTARIALLNGLGQEVGSRQVALTGASTRAQLELAGVKPGLYTVRVTAGGQSATQRLVVQP